MTEPDGLALLHTNVMSFASGRWMQTGTGIYLEHGIIGLIGSADDIERYARERKAQIVDFIDHPGATCFPAFMDSHLHLDMYGFSLLHINFNGVTSLEDALARIRAAGRPDNGTWVYGDCWDEELWKTKPHRKQLDELYRNSPVVLNRKDCHSLWLNTAALKAVGLWEPDRFGTDLVPRDTDGPTGIVHDAAQGWALSHLPEPSLEERLNALQKAIASLLSQGFGSCCNMDYGIFPELQVLIPAMEGEPRVRIWQAIGVDHLDAAIQLGLRSGFGSDFLRIGGIKVFADGSLGSRTAYMEQPWPGDPPSHGYHTYTSVDQLASWFRKADEHSLWIWIHAIGDRANKEVLDAFEEAGVAASRGHAHHRIEHAQFLRAQDFARFASLGVDASVQPSHLDLDIGKLRTAFNVPHPYSYAFRSLLKAGTALDFGSDAPVEDVDALKGMAFAAFRQRDSEQPYQPQECISLADALTAYTVAPQNAVGLLGRRGNLAPGEDGDVAVLSRNILSVSSPEDVRSAKVLLTVVNGAVAYQG